MMYRATGHPFSRTGTMAAVGSAMWCGGSAVTIRGKVRGHRTPPTNSIIFRQSLSEGVDKLRMIP